jgi:hypothetical protein
MACVDGLRSWRKPRQLELPHQPSAEPEGQHYPDDDAGDADESVFDMEVTDDVAPGRAAHTHLSPLLGHPETVGQRLSDCR